MSYWKHGSRSIVISLCAVLLTFLHLSSMAADAPVIITIDNDGSVERTGYWASSGGANPYGSGSEYSITGQFIWNVELPVAGEYSVQAYWTSYSNRTRQALYAVNQQSGIDEVIMNQRTGGGEWVELGRYQFSEGAANVALSNASDGTLSADAVRFVLVDDVVVVPGDSDAPIVVDNTDSNVYRAGYWAASSGASPYAGGSEYSRTGEFTWSPHVPLAGQYDVQVRWTQHPSRTGKAQYLIEHALGDTAATLDQKVDGGDWVSLGTYSFDRTYPNITVKNAGGYGTLSADAIRLVKFDGPVTTSGDVNDDASVTAFVNMSRWVAMYINDDYQHFLTLNPVGSYGYRQPFVKLIGKDKLLLAWGERYCLNVGIYEGIDNGCYGDNEIIDSQAKVRMLDFSNGAYADISDLWTLDVFPAGSWAHDFSLWKYDEPPYNNIFYAEAGDIVDLRLFDDASSFVKYNKSGEPNVEYIRHYSAAGDSSQEIVLTLP